MDGSIIVLWGVMAIGVCYCDVVSSKMRLAHEVMVEGRSTKHTATYTWQDIPLAVPVGLSRGNDGQPRNGNASQSKRLFDNGSLAKIDH